MLTLLGVLLVVQAPRLGGVAGEMARSVFAAGRGFVDLDRGYYPAGQAVRRNPSLLYPDTRPDARVASPGRPLPSFMNLPLLAWLFVPLAALSPAEAGGVMLGINIAVTLVCLLLVQRRVRNCPRGLRWAMTLVFATSGPALHALNLGQTSPGVLLLLLLAERALNRGHEWRAGMWLGTACAIKMPPLALLPYLALRGRRRAVVAAGVLLLAVVTISVLCYGWALHLAYFRSVIVSYWGASVAAHGNQSVDAALARVLTDASLLSWRPVGRSRLADAATGLAVAVLAVAVGLGLRRARPPVGSLAVTLELGAVLCLSLLVFPIVWVHYGMWLIPVAVTVGAAIRGEPRDSSGKVGAAGLLITAVALVNLPVPPPWVIERLDTAMWFRTVISHQLVGTAILLGLCLRGAGRNGPGDPVAPR